MKIIVAPDKFKGSLTSFEACDAFLKGLKSKAEMEVKSFPMADGGDGFAEVMKYYYHTATISCDTVDPLGRHIQARYEWDETNRTAIIEMAVASGLVLLKESERDPLQTSSQGTGLMIRHALNNGADRIILGLGGSATNDAGMGILAAMGFSFLNEKGEELRACGQNLLLVKKIVAPSPIPPARFEIACDVKNVLYGPQGAAYVYAPQKGANKEAVKWLDDGLRNFSEVIGQQTGINVADIPGTGAAGGIAAALLPFFEVVIKQGVEMIAEASHIRDHLAEADLLITGEGKLDEQSQDGKVVGYLSELAAAYGVPAMALCGELQMNDAGIKRLGLQKALALQDASVTKEEAIKNAASLATKKIPELLGW